MRRPLRRKGCRRTVVEVVVVWVVVEVGDRIGAGFFVEGRVRVLEFAIDNNRWIF